MTRLAPGRYGADIAEAWTLRPLPQGGIVTALALRAMERELDDAAQQVRTLHTTYVGQVARGPVEIAVETLRHGRSMSHLRAEVANPGTGHGHLTVAAFGRPRHGFSFTDLAPPPRTAPSACRSWREELPPEAADFEQSPFWAERVEGRTVAGHAPWEDYVPESAEIVLWYRLDDPAWRDDGTMDPFALVVLADTMPGAVGERVGRSEGRWFAPSVDLTVHLLAEWRSPWVLAHNRARYAGDGYASADMALWDCGEDGADEPRLVAYATQVFLFTFPE